ncbi:MAG TPA: hypothetical protein VGO74_02795 [Modestobacter sp.]|nr:hypothetical protein [Modestobacter sp.]
MGTRTMLGRGGTEPEVTGGRIGATAPSPSPAERAAGSSSPGRVGPGQAGVVNARCPWHGAGQ